MVANQEMLVELNQLVSRLYQQGECRIALQIAQYAVLKTKETYGNNHPEYAKSLNNLALLYDSLGEHEKAEPLYLEALQVTKTVLGENHADFAAFLNDLSLISDSFGANEEVGEISSELSKDMQDEDDPDYAESLENMAELCNFLAEYQKAEPLCTQALQQKKRGTGR